MTDRVFCEWPSGEWVTSASPEFQADLADFVSRLGPPSLVEFRAAGEGYAPASGCDDCGKCFSQCRCDGYDPAPPKPMTFLGALHDHYLDKYGHLLDDQSIDSVEVEGP